MALFIYEGRGKDARTGHEKIAMRNIKGAYNWIVGGYVNDLEDGINGYLPKTREGLFDLIYTSAMNELYGIGGVDHGKAPKEMRFAGEKFCRAYLTYLMDNDPDIGAIAEAAHWN